MFTAHVITSCEERKTARLNDHFQGYQHSYPTSNIVEGVLES